MILISTRIRKLSFPQKHFANRNSIKQRSNLHFNLYGKNILSVSKFMITLLIHTQFYDK